MAATKTPPPLSPHGNEDGYAAAHMSLRRQILRECEEMAEYAFASGMRVPPAVMRVVEAAVAASRTAGAAGLEQPDDPDGEEIARLVAAHEQLAKVVAPATPRSLVILANHRDDGSRLSFLGPVPFVRRMMLVAASSLVFFVVLVVLPGITGDVHITNGMNPATGQFRTILESQFWSAALLALANYSLLLSAASMGACFAALFQANQYITERTYDPQHEVSYWIKYVVGLMAGLILCVMIPLELGEPGTVAGTLDKPLLALLGGFSASAVHRILNRLVETVESLVRGSSKEMVGAAQEQARLRAEAQTEQVRLKMAASLVDLQKEMAAGGDPDAMRRRLDGMVGTLVPERIDGISALAMPSANGASAKGNGAASGLRSAAAGATGAAAGLMADLGAAAFPAGAHVFDDDEDDLTEQRMAFRDEMQAHAAPASEVAAPPPGTLQAVSAYAGAQPLTAVPVGAAPGGEADDEPPLPTALPTPLPSPAPGASFPSVAPAPLPASDDEAVG